MEMSMGFLFLVLAVVARTAATPPVLTIMSPDGDIVDCININDQPAFDHPLLRNHTVLEGPAYLPDIDDTNWQVWHENGTKCPKGTIPVRRLSGTIGSQPGREATLGHEYAIGFLNPPPPKIYGTKAVMNVWHPKVERAKEFSLGQVWLTAGSYENNELNSIEAGWQVYPEIYMDYQPRLFIFWTADAYTSPKCYNLRCPGFIQTSRKVLIEGAISPQSTFGGSQTELTIQIWKDPNLGPWWLGVRLSNGSDLTPIGYWPLELFTSLTDHAENVQWGGEIVNLNVSGRQTSTQMGSGFLPGNDKAAYVRDLQIALSIGKFQAVSDLKVGATNPTYYNVEKYSNTSFAYGGPERGDAVQLSLDAVLVCICCFGLFLFF
ncbi:hypothetical protein F2Q69_00002982 [Brassica cretica]|uniref:Neprosin PEP catalytic domain-containing protein n=1 Tax=Brassica cretica TaxID=69181 RepID=A0A8S9NXE8_BRACR|nr:hypothetical protein F2Q69_00002982 [Brassica cretica]